MGIIIKHKRDLWTKFPLWMLAIMSLGLSPLIIGVVGAYFSEIITGEPCHEGNCVWGALPWYSMITIPIGVILLVISISVVIIDYIRLHRKK